MKIHRTAIVWGVAAGLVLCGVIGTWFLMLAEVAS